MEKHHKFSIGFLIIGACFTFWLQHLIFTNFGIRTIPYSEFLNLLKESKISTIAITPHEIQGKFKEVNASVEKEISFKTIRVDTETSSLLEKYHVTFTGRIESDFIPTLLSWTLPTLFFLGIWVLMMKMMMKQRPGFMTLGKKKAKLYMESDITLSFEDVAGIDEARQELIEIVDFLSDGDKYTQIGGKLPKGILLVGPPGTGKTLLAKAVAGESGVPFFSLSGSEFVEMFAGLGASRVRDLFEQGKEMAPCIIFIDELDALGKARSAGTVAGNDEREQTLNQLLVEMDGFDSATGIILIAATNRPEILDPALLRPGRFDRQVLVDRPDKKGREEILRLHLKTVRAEKDLDIEMIASITSGMAGADLANLVNEAALLAVRKKIKRVGFSEFEESMERIMAGLERKNRCINPNERRVIACHEMGHAIVTHFLPGMDPVQKISIIPRGISALGYTLQRPTQDRFLMNKTELLNRITTLLGGRAAEAVIFGEISTGALNDLSRATDIAQSMVKEYGMSEKLGQVYFARKRNAPFLQTPLEGIMEYSNDTALIIDTEIRKILDVQYESAKAILCEKKQTLEKGAALLLERETIEGNDIDQLMNGDSQAEKQSD